MSNVVIAYRDPVFAAHCTFTTKDVVKAAGFRFHWGTPDKCPKNCIACTHKVLPKMWWTSSPHTAARLATHPQVEFTIEARAAITSSVETVKESSAIDADIDIPTPEGLALFPFQKAGVKFALARKNTLIGDEPGLGKTLQAIGLVNADPSIKSVLVVCPKAVLLNWRDEFKKWSVRKTLITVVGVEGDTVEGTSDFIDITICSYTRVKQLPDMKWDLLVVDEAHYVKNPKAQRSQLILGVPANRKTNTPETLGLVQKSTRHLFLTGTPVLNRPIELWSIVHALAPSEFPEFFPFARRYCGAHKTDFGWDFNGATNLDELQIKLRSSMMIRRLKKDVLTELPPKVRQVVAIERPRDVEKLLTKEKLANDRYEQETAKLRDEVEFYGLLDRSGQAYQDAVARLKTSASVLFQEIAKARHDLAMAKVPYVIEHVKEFLEASEDQKLIVFAHHKDVQHALIEEFKGYEVASILGDHTAEERHAEVKRFQEKPLCRVVICSLMAANIGITLTAASTVVFAELDWVPANVTQAEDRAHRIGQKNSVLVQHLVFDGSLDSQMAKTLINKQSIADRVLDKDPNANIPVVGEEAEAKQPKYEPVADDERASVHASLQFLSARCDGAHAEDERGFNAVDSKFGKKLASLVRLSDGQVHWAKRMLVKYRRQLAVLGN